MPVPMLVCYSLVKNVPERPATTSPLSDSGSRPRALGTLGSVVSQLASKSCLVPC